MIYHSTLRLSETTHLWCFSSLSVFEGPLSLLAGRGRDRTSTQVRGADLGEDPLDRCFTSLSKKTHTVYIIHPTLKMINILVLHFKSHISPCCVYQRLKGITFSWQVLSFSRAPWCYLESLQVKQNEHLAPARLHVLSLLWQNKAKLMRSIW